MPSRKANRLRVLACGLASRWAAWNPSSDHRGVNVPAITRISSRTVCTTVSRWPAQICTNRSPPVRVGVQAIEREGGHRGQVARLLRCQPVAMIEQRRAERERDRQRIGRVVGPEDPGVRRRVVDLLDADRRALRQLANPDGQLLQSEKQLRRRLRDRVQRDHRRLRLARGEDPRLVLAVERVADHQLALVDSQRLGREVGRRGGGVGGARGCRARPPRRRRRRRASPTTPSGSGAGRRGSFRVRHRRGDLREGREVRGSRAWPAPGRARSAFRRGCRRSAAADRASAGADSGSCRHVGERCRMRWPSRLSQYSEVP